MMTDPIADLLTRIRNANRIYRESVDIPRSNVKENIVKVLLSEGYISNYQIVDDGPQKSIRVFLKYGNDGEFLINHLARVSKPGCRRYSAVNEMKPVLNGLGIRVLSTSKGVMSNRKAKEAKMGGEVICEVW